jgi:hypothetical protein
MNRRCLGIGQRRGNCGAIFRHLCGSTSLTNPTNQVKLSEFSYNVNLQLTFDVKVLVLKIGIGGRWQSGF